MSVAPIPQAHEHVPMFGSSNDHVLLTMYPAELK